jgi:hypothetical protein
VPAAREQARERRLEVGRLQEQRGDVAVEMVDRDERQLTRQASAFAVATPTRSAPISPARP